MSGGNYVPMYVALGILFMVAMLPLFIQPFINNGNVPVNNQSWFYTTGNTIINGVDVNLSFIPLIGFTAHVPSPFGILGNQTNSEIGDYILDFAYIPNEVFYPLAIVFIFSIVYVLIKFIPTES